MSVNSLSHVGGHVTAANLRGAHAAVGSVTGGVVSRLSIEKALKEKNPDMTPDMIYKVLDVFFSELSAALICGDRVELRGFGSWIVRKRKKKVVRNPKTNDKLLVGDKGSLYFRASRELIGRVNGAQEG
ncbi:Integration host factor subunit beta [Candidatus Cyrtobacter comes]|uniref:Integration host factor subunit beta n=1 Tax=Candidatus Cyrtobacter comes TaxID=675776 RepID=A0ABU5L6L3_9RICK|nr:HU family DNA-binding protein [Candidatus Cyrtobacter comes]MDZ5761766.1 Integration host factor subunit beta [Candidatus Cyrtobacter comes]